MRQYQFLDCIACDIEVSVLCSSVSLYLPITGLVPKGVWCERYSLALADLSATMAAGNAILSWPRADCVRANSNGYSHHYDPPPLGDRRLACWTIVTCLIGFRRFTHEFAGYIIIHDSCC
jgi:hypothetical protein